MLETVDIPAAVAGRDDLRLWLTAGEHDYFGEADQRAILDASPSPAALKRLVLIPGGGHGDHWRWAGNDQLIRDFLAAASPHGHVREAAPRQARRSFLIPAACAVSGAAYFLLRRRRRLAA
jgi:hypothetical protein